MTYNNNLLMIPAADSLIGRCHEYWDILKLCHVSRGRVSGKYPDGGLICEELILLSKTSRVPLRCVFGTPCATLLASQEER